MDVKFQVVGREDVPQNDRASLTVETHGKRGETFNVMKVDTVLEGDEPVVFRIPVGGRLLITAPDDENEVVYDPEQGAAVRRSQQENTEGKADDARTGAQRQGVPPAGALGASPPQDVKPVQNPPGAQMTTNQPSGHPTQAEIAAKNRADAQAKAQADAKAKLEAEAKARADAQKTGSTAVQGAQSSEDVKKAGG